MTGQIEGRLWDAQIQLLAISDTKIPAIALDEGVLRSFPQIFVNFQGLVENCETTPIRSRQLSRTKQRSANRGRGRPIHKQEMPMWAIVPIKTFERAKQRLANVLNEEERRSLMLAMARDVLTCLSKAKNLDGILIVSRAALQQARSQMKMAMTMAVRCLSAALMADLRQSRPTLRGIARDLARKSHHCTPHSSLQLRLLWLHAWGRVLFLCPLVHGR